MPPAMRVLLTDFYTVQREGFYSSFLEREHVLAERSLPT